jgi:hypothetical protein
LTGYKKARGIIQAIRISVNPVSTSLLQLFNDQELAFIQRTFIAYFLKDIYEM